LQKLPFKKQGYTNTLGEACIINMILGCTMVFNRKALELFLRAKREDITSLHDEWLYKACLAVEGNVVYDTTSHILYRQHGSNVVGANKGAFQQWKGRWLNFWGCKRTRSTVLLNIWKVYSNLIPECNKSIILPLISTSRNPFRRIYTMFSPKYKTLSKSTNILFKLSFLTNRY
jgi:rhamnosyltransferase